MSGQDGGELMRNRKTGENVESREESDDEEYGVRKTVKKTVTDGKTQTKTTFPT